MTLLMKKLFLILFTVITMSLTSCMSVGTTAVVYDDTPVCVQNGVTYYNWYKVSYYDNSVPVIFVNGLYYYQYYDGVVGLYWRRPIPRDRFKFFVKPFHRDPRPHRPINQFNYRRNHHQGPPSNIRNRAHYNDRFKGRRR